MTRKVVTALSILAAVIVALFWISTYVDSILGKEYFYIGPPDMGVEWINGMWIAELVDGDTLDGFRGGAALGHCGIGHSRSRRPMNLGQPFQFNLGPFAVLREYFDPNDDWSSYGERTRLTREQAQALPTIMAVHMVEFDIWLVFVLVAAYPAARMIWWPLRRRRRGKRGLCPSCGYDLTENTSGVCPECAAKVGGVGMGRSRTRRVAKWVGLVGSVLLGVVWFLTLFWGGGYIGATNTIVVSSGKVGLLLYTNDPGDYVGWIWYRNRDVDLGWWPSYDDSTSPAAGPFLRQRTRRLIVPLWIPFLLTAIATIILWRRDRRRLVGHCRKCEYDLTGNVTGVCSECGTKVGAA